MRQGTCAGPDPEVAVTQAVQALGAPDPRTRLSALKALLDSGDMSCCQHLAIALPHEPHPQVRAAMVMVLARLGGATQANVIARFTEDPDVGVRLRAVDALGGFPSADCAAALVRVLGHEHEGRVRDVAAHFPRGTSAGSSSSNTRRTSCAAAGAGRPARWRPVQA